MSAQPMQLEVNGSRVAPTLSHASARVTSLDTVDDCEVNDLSPVGAEIRSSESFELNQRVELEIPPIGLIPGRVTWCRGHHFGVQFMAPLDSFSLAKVPQRLQCKAGGTGRQRTCFARADLEARLVLLSRKLSDADLEIALGQIAELSSHQGR